MCLCVQSKEERLTRPELSGKRQPALTENSRMISAKFQSNLPAEVIFKNLNLHKYDFVLLYFC